MTWLVFGVSCLLVLAGAVSIISGAPIIQLERGWAEVIAGTVALSSGGVVFALAGILMRLEAIRDTVAARSIPVAAEGLPAAVTPALAIDRAPPAPPLPATPALPPAPPALPSESAPVAEEDGKTEGLWKRVKRSGPEKAVAERPDTEDMRQRGFPDRIVPDAMPPAAPPTAATPVVVPAHPVPDGTPATDATGSLPEAVAEAERDPGRIAWLERSLFKGPAERTDASPGRPEPSLAPLPFERLPPREARVEPTLAGAPLTPPLSPMPEPTAAAEPAPTPDIASEQHGGATVVGRYQAGSASYVMYSDGTIEVETESGEIHRFGSMDELKAFIAQQDTTVS